VPATFNRLRIAAAGAPAKSVLAFDRSGTSRIDSLAGRPLTLLSRTAGTARIQAHYTRTTGDHLAYATPEADRRQAVTALAVAAAPELTNSVPVPVRYRC
jgi:hypothetical protein